MLSMLAVGYLFLGGLGAGACVVSSLLALLTPADEVVAARRAKTADGYALVANVASVYRRLIAPGYAAAFVALGLGCVLLVADLGAPSRFVALFAYPTATLMSAGAYALVACLALTAFLAVAWGASSVHVRYGALRFVQWLAAAAGLFVATYTGLLLSSMGTVPLWSSVWLPVLFALSSLSGGCALTLALASATGSMAAFDQVIRRIMGLDVTLMALEAAAAAMLLAAAFANPYAVAAQGAQSLIGGAYAAAFVVGFGVVGLATPAALELGAMRLGARHIMLAPAISALVLVGAFTLRFCIVAAGMHPEVWTVL